MSPGGPHTETASHLDVSPSVSIVFSFFFKKTQVIKGGQVIFVIIHGVILYKTSWEKC